MGAVNHAPTAGAASITLDQDTVKSGTLPAATDIDGDAVTYAKASNPSHGSVTVNGDGSYSYTPNASYVGSDSFSYKVSDGKGGENTYTVSVTVGAVNHAPTAGVASITLDQDTVKSGTLPAATDIDGDAVTYAKASDPSHGTVTVNGNGGYSYTPNTSYVGSDSFSYKVSDGKGGENTYTVSVTVGAVNHAPTAGAASITLDQDTVKSGTLPAATDIDGDAVTYAKASNPSHGSVIVNGNGSYSYTPNASYVGSDSFTYKVSDGKGGENTYTVSVTVGAVNHAPTAGNASISLNQDTVKSGNLPAASDIDGDTVTYAKASNPSHGSVTVNGNGSYSYTPNASYVGNDSFSYKVSDGKGGENIYTVSVNVAAVNHAPSASNASISLNQDTVKSGSLPAATDADGDTVTYATGSDPSHGTVIINANGTYVYSPDANYRGSDVFTYTVNDGRGGTNKYIVSVTVAAVNHAPTAGGASITLDQDTVKSGSLPAAKDVDGDTVTYAKGSNPSHGSVTVSANGTYVYTPNANYRGSDSFTYTIDDGHGGSNTYTISVTVAAVNHAPIASSASITLDQDTVKSGSLPTATDIDGDTVTYAKAGDPSHGSLTVSADGSYVYTPNADYRGSDSFSYQVSDGHGGANTYTVSVTVAAVNHAPVAGSASITTPQEQAVSGRLPTATDRDGDAVTYAMAGNASHGTAVVNADGSYSYTPVYGFSGADSFSYSVADGKGGSNTYTVSVNVTAVNHAPVGSGMSVTTAEDTPLSGSLPATTDRDGDPITYSLGAGASHGTVSVGANGSFSYTPARDYNGADSFTYVISDGRGGSASYNVSINVTPVNDAPVGHGGADGAGTVGDPMAPVSVPAFTDVDSPVITYTATLSNGSPLPGWLSFDPATRTFSGTPPAGSAGTLAIKVTGSDGQLSDSVAVTITVKNPPAPTQSVSIASMSKDTGVSASDFITNDGSAGRSVNGGLSAALGKNEVVQVSFDGGATWTTASTSGMSWSATDNGAHGGNWTIVARVTNTVTSQSGSAASRDVVLDTTPPAMPTVDSQTTSSTTPTLTGTAQVGPGEILRISVNGGTYEVSAPGGNWSLGTSGAPLVPGQSYDVTATITDVAGNTRSATGKVSVSVPVVVQPQPQPDPAPQPTPAPVTPTQPSAPPPVTGGGETPSNPASPSNPSSPSSSTSTPAAPGSMVGGDAVQVIGGRGARPGESSTEVQITRSAELSDVYTRSEGFRTVVAQASEPALVLFQGVPDQFVESGTHLSLSVPADAFAHTQPKAIVRLAAQLQDGRPLPSWVTFNGQTGQFTGDAPPGLRGELRIKVIARDMDGREAVALFRVNVGQGRVAGEAAKTPAGKPSLSQQLRAAGQRPAAPVKVAEPQT